MSDYPEVGTLLSHAHDLLKASQLEEADVLFRQILDFDPAHKEARLRRILIARRTGRREDALTLIDEAIRTDPSNANWHVGRALALIENDRHDEAFAAYDRAIALRDDCADAWFGKAQLLLLLGRYNEGWELYEWRFYVTGWPGETRLFRQPMWGGGGFHGQMQLIYAEQGLGDTIQFYRFVIQARSFGGVIVEAPDRLVRLLRSQPQAPLVIPAGEPLPAFDLQCPMMSLPMLLGTELHSIPSGAYLHADPELSAEWSARLPASDGRLRVGISWASGLDSIDAARRTMPLSLMLDMLGAEVSIVSLQREVPVTDGETLRDATHILDLGPHQADLADTAAIISQLDLVITVDSVVAHLAGAMGLPVWILLPSVADWRWLLRREDSPWVPNGALVPANGDRRLALGGAGGGRGIACVDSVAHGPPAGWALRTRRMIFRNV